MLVAGNSSRAGAKKRSCRNGKEAIKSMKKVFECRMCGDCCYGEGGIFVLDKEKEKIAHFLKITVPQFLMEFCQERNGKTYLKAGEDNFCIFFDREIKGCGIHLVKPGRCELWPYFPANVNDRETWEMAKTACRGFNRDCSFEDFKSQAPTAIEGNEETDNDE